MTVMNLKLLGGGIALFGVLTGLSFVPLISIKYLGLTETEARVLGNSIAAASTFSLVVVTFLTVLQNEKIVEKQELELMKGRQEEYVSDIILPTKSIIESNRSRIADPKAPVAWSQNPIRSGWDTGEGGEKAPDYSLLKVCSREDLYGSDLSAFESEYPEIYKEMSKHDELLQELVDAAESVATQANDDIFLIGGVVGRYLVDFAIDETGRIDTSHLGIKPSQWNDNRETILSDIEDDCPVALERFRERRKEYIEHVYELASELEELRGEISEKYHV